MVIYDLNKPGKDYTSLTNAIKAYGSGWWHCLTSTWIINTFKTPYDVASELLKLMDASDELLVLDITGDNWSCYGLNKECTDWLKSNL